MTRIIHRQSLSPDSRLLPPTQTLTAEKGPTSSLQVGQESTSDNDAGERPVREKLKKTSIASIPKYGVVSASPDVEEHEVNEMDAQDNGKEVAKQENHAIREEEKRGRPIRKRSLEEIDDTQSREGKTEDRLTQSSGGHARKRSRDVRAGLALNIESRRIDSPGMSVQEEDEDRLEKNIEQHAVPPAAPDTPPSIDGDADQEMKESALSPRKKRSRDQFEPDTPREQKIAATDETKARRRSSEDSRGDESRSGVVDQKEKEIDQQSQNGNVVAPGEVSRRPNAGILPKIALSSGFANTSSVSPFGNLAGHSLPPSITPISNKDSASQQTQTSSTNFENSGFGSFSKSTASPFGTLGTSAKPSITRPPSTSSAGSTHETLVEKPPQDATSSGHTMTSTDFGPSGMSTSTISSGMSGFGTISAPTLAGGFGGGFGGVFGSGTGTLTTFAGPISDLKLGTDKISTKPFGASADKDENEGTSDDEGESSGEMNGEGDEEADSRFHHVEVDTGEEGELTLFHAHGKLFCFDGKGWVERGVGTFKLNKAEAHVDTSSHPHLPNDEYPDSTDQKPTARFIMRAQQTHRVVLNAPVFKQMSIGNKDGSEPPGKQISFAVVEGGRINPYLLRLGREDDIKELYRAVKQLQRIL